MFIANENGKELYDFFSARFPDLGIIVFDTVVCDYAYRLDKKSLDKKGIEPSMAETIKDILSNLTPHEVEDQFRLAKIRMRTS